MINNGPADAAARGTPASASGNRSERASTTASAPEGVTEQELRRVDRGGDPIGTLDSEHGVAGQVLRRDRTSAEPDCAQLVVEQLTRAFGRARVAVP